MDTPGVEITIHEHARTADGPIIIAEVKGRITIAEADSFSDRVQLITSQHPVAAVIDCRDLGFLSSAGIGEFIKLDRALKGQNSKMMLANVPKEVMNVFEKSKLDEMMPMYVSVDEAIRTLTYA